MYISRIVVRNYRNIKHLDLAIHSGITLVVGENNTGKTNLLRAIRLPIDATLSSQHRSLSPHDFYSGVDYRTTQQILVSLEFSDFRGKENEEAMVAGWAIDDDRARLTYRFRPRNSIIEAIETGELTEYSLSIDDYRWEIAGAGGNIDPAIVAWNETFGRSIKFEELQHFIVVILPPMRDVEQSLRQVRFSPLSKLISSADIPEDEQAELVRNLSDANDNIAQSATISSIGEKIDKSFSEAAGSAFKMKVDIGMAPPSFDDISRSLSVLLSDKSLKKFDPNLNGLGLNNVLYVSMLLRYFEERISASTTPGQLLLFEEPEAHLHPQLQRVLFKNLFNKNFQAIATSHSTHITSQIPIKSIIVLTDDGTPAVASSIPAQVSNLTEKNIADLERYLDATRGTLLFAKKVMLVEGPAELFLIPPLIKTVLNIDLEENGISIIPIFGVHFEAYARIFCPDGITKKCAIVTDGDLKSSDATDANEEDPEELPDIIPPNLNELENEFVKIFVCETTFEKELTNEGNISMFIEASRELGATVVASKLSDPEYLSKAKDLVLATAKRFGKARFAQVASKYVSSTSFIPTYIQDALDWLKSDDSTE